MEYISADTNVWLDFIAIDELELPFLLSYRFIMHKEVIEDELLYPPHLGKRLLELGLLPTELTEEEFYMVEKLMQQFSKPSLYDCIALAIAKNRKISLMTRDKALRKAANYIGVKVIGTIGILDELYRMVLITKERYRICLIKLNGKKVRLPIDELDSRRSGVI